MHRDSDLEEGPLAHTVVTIAEVEVSVFLIRAQEDFYPLIPFPWQKPKALNHLRIIFTAELH